MNWVTLYDTLDVHLTKEVGAIAYGMHSFYQINSYVTQYSEKEYERLEASLPGLKVLKIKKITGNFNVDACLFLLHNSHKIDVLNIYHISTWPSIFSIIYKLCNRKGKIYLKCDCTAKIFIDAKISEPKRQLYKALYKRADVISSETEESRILLEKYIGRKVIRVPNPVLDIYGCIPFEQRDNTIIAVARLGDTVKRIDLLVEGFCQAFNKIENWNLKLVGPGDDDFARMIKYKKIKYPVAMQHVSIVGNISDRKRLKRELQNSKIMCMPSISESFGISFLEAGATGNFLIGTNQVSFAEMTDGWKYGLQIEINSSDSIRDALTFAGNHQKLLENNSLSQSQFIINNYSLQTVCGMIYRQLFMKCREENE